MVFFNCNACGEAVKKNQVEKHYRQQCRSCEVLSCVDCGKEFWGDEYQQHTKCITEDEKFGGKSYKPKPNANKGEQKQELWISQVQDAISKVKANPKLKNLLERIEEYPNIPRKQAKFENFLRNSMRIMDPKLATQAWNAISAELNAAATKNTNGVEAKKEANNSASSDPVSDKNKETEKGSSKVISTEDGKKSKKRKREEEMETSEDVPMADNAETQYGKKSKKRKREKDIVSEKIDAKRDEGETSGKNGEVSKMKKHKKKRGEETEDVTETAEKSKKKKVPTATLR